jgi:hypothetical protein
MMVNKKYTIQYAVLCVSIVSSFHPGRIDLLMAPIGVNVNKNLPLFLFLSLLNRN